MMYDKTSLQAKLASALPDGNMWLTNDEIAEKILPVVEEIITEIDRNARAFGWEIGQGNGHITEELVASPENPFVNPAWRTHINGEKKSS